MQFCSACQKTPATIDVLDLSDGSVTGQKHLCAACAEGMGLVQPKMPIKMSAEILEDLLGTIKGAGTTRRREIVCPGCGMTPQDFKQKGRLGCPRCYEAFRQDLVPLLQRVHESVVHRGRLPGGRAPAPPAPGPTALPTADTERLADLRRRLEDAIRGERYEEAARLRDDLRRAEKGEVLP
jgi:protein arginine kinase activator